MLKRATRQVVDEVIERNETGENRGEQTTVRLQAIKMTDADAQRNPGATWTAPGSVLVSQVPEAGRVMLGNVRVVTTGGVQVGSADVVVEHVSP